MTNVEVNYPIPIVMFISEEELGRLGYEQADIPYLKRCHRKEAYLYHIYVVFPPIKPSIF